MSLGAVLLIVILLLLVGSLLGHGRWGYAPSGGLGLALTAVLILLLLGFF